MRAKIIVTVIAVIMLIAAAAFQSKAKAPTQEIVLPDIVIQQ